MPGNLPTPGGSGAKVQVTAPLDNLGTSRGRKRYCKKCKFTCTDAREFTAHQATHTESDDSKEVSETPSLPTSSASQSQRTLRPKRSSKTSISDTETPRSNMDVAKEVLVETPGVKGVKTADSVIHDTPLILDFKQPVEVSLKFSQNCESGSLNFSKEANEEELMDADEDGDEPDAMMSSSQEDVKNVSEDNNDESRLQSDITDYFSGDEDAEDDDKLIIDGESLAKTPTGQNNVQNRKYSCQKCELVTSSARLYLHHLNETHHSEVSIYECDFCDFATVYKDKLTTHRKIHFVPEKSDDYLNSSFDSTDKEPLNKPDERNSFTTFSFPNLSKLPSFINQKPDDLEDEEEEDETSFVENKSSFIPIAITPENIDQVLDEDKKKKKKTRQEVDPGKYFEAVDSSGTKYACSQCGNIYKWRKSLNKHWKEKHSLDPLAEVASPPGMLELLKSGKYTQLGARRIYDKTFLATIKTNKNEDPSRMIISSSHTFSQAQSPPKFLTSPSTIANKDSRLDSTVALIPKMIGPFISNTQPVFPGMPIPMSMSHLSVQGNEYDSPEEGALDLTRDSKPSSRNSPYIASSQKQNASFNQEQPLDFSRSNMATEKVKGEKPWENINSMKPAHSINQLIPRQHQCSKCDFTSTSEVEFANHTSSHMNKRIVRCFECKLQFHSMDELNNHFIKLHYRKLTEYKEAIKKIPHGLQQTYHILNMSIHDIGELGSQDLGASEGKSLKCKKCDFEAKWPAELQKHAVSHSEERPYICMVCGSTYKWKWDLVKHFQKSHKHLPNPYRRNDNKDTPDGSTEDEDEPVMKKAKIEANSGMVNGNMFSRDDNISVEGIIAATQAGQRLISSQPNLLDDEPVTINRNLGFLNEFPYASSNDIAQVAQLVQAAHVAQEIDRRKTQKAMQDAVKNRQNSSGSSSSSSTSKKNVGRETTSLSPSPGGSKSEELPYKCTMCNYHARWPSEVTQHMKNHSDSKPYLCPRCEYRSKWKWDVVKHLKRCGGGGINDVIDTTKIKKKDYSVSNGPPNAVVSQQGKVKKMTPQPSLSYLLPSMNENGQQGALVVKSSQNQTSDASSGDDCSRPGSGSSIQDLSNSSNNNNDSSAPENNVNNNYAAYTNGLPFEGLNTFIPVTANVLSTLTGISSSKSPALSPSPSPAVHTTSSRQNAEIWNCPHCPFITQSQAELKRHSGLHSDDKPFKCDVCLYSTRWACDLKKHRKSYNHFPKHTIFKDQGKPQTTAQGRFRCTQCSIFFQTLQNLLEHRMAEHIGQESSQSSPAPATEIEIDAARIKHPRKQVKKIECTKCPFVCKSRQTMDKHMEEHELLELSGIQCFYCSSLFKDKESLLDHITTHSAFNPKEWETFFMISDDDQHQVKDDGKISSRKDFKPQQNNPDKADTGGLQLNKKYTENEKASSDSTEARIQQILNEVPKQITASQHTPNINKFKCEWCSAEFVNLTAVYKHAGQAHPIQLKEQDVSMTLAGQNISSKSSISHKLAGKKLYAGDLIESLKQQIEEKRNHQLSEKYDDIISSNSKTQDTMLKKVEDERNTKLVNNERNTFPSGSLVAHKQQELKGNKPVSQCWFCEYSVDKMNLLYQHMKISHTRKWKALSQDPKYANQINRMNMAFANSIIHGSSNDSLPDASQVVDSSAMDLSSKSKPSHSEVTHDILYITKQQYTWSGIPVNIVPMGNALNFVCPHCAFHDASIAETCCHVMQSHSAISKFTCKTCQYSDDNIHVMSDHCKKEHPIQERIVEVLDFKQINFSELQIVQLNALREQMANDPSKRLETKPDAKTLASKAMSCPFCPFKTLITEHMKAHVSDHSKQARYRCQMCDFSSDSTSVISEHVQVHDAGYTLDWRSIPDIKLPLNVKKEPKDRKMKEPDSKVIPRGCTDTSELAYNDQEGSPRSKLAKRIRYRCSVCPYHTTCRSNIWKHVRQHNNNKKYKCSKCSYGAARAVLLKNHLDSHDTPLEDDGQYHDIFCDPNNADETLKGENNDNDSEETEMDVEDFDDENDEDGSNSDDSDEIDVKAIVDLEAKDILEAEASHTASILIDDNDGVDKQFRKQKCPSCPFSSNSGYEFRKHLNFHGTQERYKCDHCSYSLDRLNLLSQHRKLHSDEPGFNPNPPAADLLNTDFILQHSSEMADPENIHETEIQEEGKVDPTVNQFGCLYCPFKTNKKILFDIHCNNHDQHKHYICDFCDWSADQIGLLLQHRQAHEKEPTFNPSLDEKMFLNQEFDDGTSGEFEAKFMEIKQTDKQVEAGELETPLSPPFKLTVVKKSYPCKLCPYKTNSKNSYSVHKDMHDSGAEFSCRHCSYASINKGLLQQHLRLHVPLGLRVCSTASSMGRSPVNQQQLLGEERVHLQQESGSVAKKETKKNDSLSDPELKCQRCPFTASSPITLKEHMRCHTAQENLTCPYCDYSATSKQIMFPHIQIHFPGTKLETEALELMLEEHTKATNNNIPNSLDPNNHDLKTHDLTSNLSPKPDNSTQLEKETVRIYVCHFCEREFDAKNLMIQHEKQHLVGGHTEDSGQTC